jgi:hypothetical protein
MERYVLATLAKHRGLSLAELAAQHRDAKGGSPPRSLRSSLGRSLRRLKAKRQVVRQGSIFYLTLAATDSRYAILPNSGKVAAAYHEAGHAVIARALGYEVRSVTIRYRQRRYAGRVQHLAVLHPRDNALIIFAGPLAEAECLRRGVRIVASARIAGTDRISIRNAIHIFVGEPTGDGRLLIRRHMARAARTKFRKQARILVRKHKAAIERVAQALMEQQTLSGKQLDRIISSRDGD